MTRLDGRAGLSAVGPVVAIIPARGGSKGVPGKNLRRVAGRSLIERAVSACRAASLIDRVYVSTDDPAIAAAARAAGAAVIDRPAEIAGDTASSESALLHALGRIGSGGVQPAAVVFVQCTSPFIAADDLDRACELVLGGQADSAFAAVETYEFLWRPDRSGAAYGQNHDPALRPRRQDRSPDLRETGAFYAMATEGFAAHRHRFFGRTVGVSVDPLRAVEIDDEHDIVVASALAPLLDEDQAPPIDVDALLTDFDGVHTDDMALVDQHGVESVSVSRSDGLGLEGLRRAGLPMAIVSKERNPVVAARAAKLGIEALTGIDDKAPAVLNWLATRGIDAERAAYVGNDVNDCDALDAVGWPIAVADAHPEVRRRARLVLSRPGGRGALRELAELILAARGEAPAGLASRAPAASTAGRDALASARRP